MAEETKRLYVREDGVVYERDLDKYTTRVEFNAHVSDDQVHLVEHDKQILNSLKTTETAPRQLLFDERQLLTLEEFQGHTGD